MNQIKNHVQLIGHLGRDVNVNTFTSGSQKADVSLATTSSYKNQQGEVIKDTQWHNIVAWGPSATLMQQLLKKGSYVVIQGSLSYRNYQDKLGVDKSITEIVVDSFVKLDRDTSASTVEKHLVASN